MIRALCMLTIGLLAPPAAAECDDLGALKKPAALGQLSPQTTTCLEKAMVSETGLTRRETLSELLIANAFANGEDAAWAGYVKVHLESVDSSDCDLMYRYGLHLLKYEAPAAAIKWAAAAEKHSYGWQPDELDSKIYDLHRLKTRSLWAIYESVKQEGGMKERAALGQVQLKSVEWMRHGTKIERDVTEALDFCIRAGWTKERCVQQAAIQEHP